MRREITPIFDRKKVVLVETKRAVTPFGGLVVFAEFLKKIGYRKVIEENIPIVLNERVSRSSVCAQIRTLKTGRL